MPWLRGHHGEEIPFTIIGVVHDFLNQSLKEDFRKIAMVHNPDHFNVASIKTKKSQKSTSVESLLLTISHIEESWKTIVHGNLFDYEFHDKNIEAFYKEEQRFAKIFQHLSVIFLGIGCFSIFGLISLMINNKMAELAIRKMLGASFPNIIGILLNNYIVLLILASFISAPAVHFVMRHWLRNFAHHIDLSWSLFVFTPLMVLSITILTVGKHTFKAVRANPADILRHE